MCKLTVLQSGMSTELEFEAGSLLADVLQAGGFAIERPCGGRGSCGKCAVVLGGHVSEINAAEKKAGVRLACQAVLLGDAHVALPDVQDMQQIETSGAEKIRLGEAMQGRYGAAVDIGTTTIALKLLDLRSGTCIGQAGMRNPQTSVAADVMGRIGAALQGKLEDLCRQVRSAIETLLHAACVQAKIAPAEVESTVITGNTTMLYLLTGRSPETLSHAPFQADCLFDETQRLFGGNAYLPPCMNAFVGGDISCAVLAADQCESDAVSLLVDIGTNGEIALWKNGVLYVSSTAAGPAFEGAGISCGCSSIRGAIDRVHVEDNAIAAHTIGEEKAVGVCGSGLIDAIACGLETGEIDETGAMDAEELPLRDGVCLLPRDVRAVQLAKAAIAAGIETLMEEAGVSADEIETFYIAGGFGSHLNVQSAARIGLIPGELADRVKVLGNAALTGAVRILLNRDDLETVRRIAGASRHVNLGGNPRFNEHYMDQMFFPEE